MFMRINWGTKLIIVYCTFVVAMLFMVFQTTRHKSEMVTSNYYEKELKYQEVIDGMQNANELGTGVKISDEADHVSIQMPSSEAYKSGMVEFYRPSDAARDITAPLATDTSGKQLFKRDKFIVGRYLVKIQWQLNGKDYYSEQSIYIQ